MQQVSCAAVLGILVGAVVVGAAAPVAAQQFTFPTGDRVLQGYNVGRVANDGSQAGGGTPGGSSETVASPYQSNLAGPTNIGGPSFGNSAGGSGNAAQDANPYARTASLDPGGGGRISGGQGAGGQGGKGDSAGGGGFGGDGASAIRPAGPSGDPRFTNVGAGGTKGALQLEGGGGPMTIPPGGGSAPGNTGQLGGDNLAVTGKLPAGFCPPPCLAGANFGGTGLGLHDADAYTFKFKTRDTVIGPAGSPPTPPPVPFIASAPNLKSEPPAITRFNNIGAINPAITAPKQNFTPPTQTFTAPQNFNPVAVTPKAVVTPMVTPTVTPVVTPQITPVITAPQVTTPAVTAPVVTTQPNIVSVPKTSVITNPAVQTQTLNNNTLKSLQNLNVQRLMNVRQGN